MELALTGRIFGAEEARQLGLVHEVAHDVAARAAEIAAQVAGFSGAAIGKGMWVVRESRGRSWKEAGELAIEARKEILASEEFRAGISKWARKD